MLNIGLFNYFSFASANDGLNGVDPNISHRTPLIDIIVSGEHSSIGLYEHGTNNNAGATITPYTWEINGIEFLAHRLTFSIPSTSNKKYYLKIGDIYSYNVVEYGSCVTEILVNNSCNNAHFPWADSGAFFTLLLADAVEVSSEIEDEQRIVVKNSGVEKKTFNQIIKRGYQFTGVSGLFSYLNALKTCDNVSIATPNGYVRIKNISVEKQEVVAGSYEVFTIRFEDYESLNDLTSCCDLLNLDDLLSPEVSNNPEACASFSAAVLNTSGTLSATLTSAPTGTPTYKWYRNGNYISAASSIKATTHGDYRVEVRIGLCRASASYFIDDKCRIFQIATSVLNGVISAVSSNVPDRETVSYVVKKDGEPVATSLPYTAVEEGAYFIEATAGACKTIKAEYVKLAAACSYTIDINDAGNQLEAVTNAMSPVYTWELETSSGKTVIGNTSTIQKVGKGIYWLTIESGECSKEAYFYDQPNASAVCSVVSRATGTVFTIPEINLIGLTSPGSQLLVTANNLVQIYVSGTPVLQNNYSINGSGQIIFANSFPLTNAILKVIRI